MNKLRSMRWGVAVAALMLGMTHSAWAGTDDQSHVVTLKVNPILSIESPETTNFDLVFDNTTGSGANSISKNKVVAYNVEANNMTNDALAGAVSAKLSVLVADVEIRGTSDATAYVHKGGADGAILTPTDPTNPVVIGTTATALFDKPASAGTAGKVLHGTAFVSWDAKLLAEKGAGTLGTPTLTVTLKDV